MKSFEETLVAAAAAGWTVTILPQPNGVIEMSATKDDRRYGIMYSNALTDVSGTAFQLQRGFCRWFDGVEKEQGATKWRS